MPVLAYAFCFSVSDVCESIEKPPKAKRPKENKIISNLIIISDPLTMPSNMFHPDRLLHNLSIRQMHGTYGFSHIS